MTGQVFRNITRAAPQTVAALGKAGAATVCEAMGRKNLLSTNLRPIYPGASIAGSAVTIKAPFGDNYMVHVAIEFLQPGDILVLAPDQVDKMAYFGEMMATSAKACGCAGLIIDAGVRDIQALKDMEFPVWASSICAAGTNRKALGSVNVPILCGGVEIKPGDIIVADDDGVCCVSVTGAERVAELAQSKANREADIQPRLAAGEQGLDVYNLRAKLNKLGIEYL